MEGNKDGEKMMKKRDKGKEKYSKDKKDERKDEGSGSSGNKRDGEKRYKDGGKWRRWCKRRDAGGNKSEKGGWMKGGMEVEMERSRSKRKGRTEGRQKVMQEGKVGSKELRGEEKGMYVHRKRKKLKKRGVIIQGKE